MSAELRVLSCFFLCKAEIEFYSQNLRQCVTKTQNLRLRIQNSKIYFTTILVGGVMLFSKPLPASFLAISDCLLANMYRDF